MKNLKEAEKQADEALKSIDNIQSIDVNEFLYTRIKNRIDALDGQIEKPIVWPLYRMAAMLVLFIAINIISYNYLLGTNTSNKSIKTNDLNTFSEDYNLQGIQNNY